MVMVNLLTGEVRDFHEVRKVVPRVYNVRNGNKVSCKGWVTFETYEILKSYPEYLKAYQWRPIKNYPDYFITDCGKFGTLPHFRKKRNGNITVDLGGFRKGYKKSTGYIEVKLDNKSTLLHRLVASHFVDGEFEGAVVDHIDRTRDNNHYENLRWVTPEFNIRIATLKSRKIIDPKGGVVITHDVPLLCQECGLSYYALMSVLNGVNSHHRGWRKYDEDLVGVAFSGKISASTSPYIPGLHEPPSDAGKVWKDLSWNTLYSVSNCGSVWSKKSNRLVGYTHKSGYRKVNIDGKSLNIHKLVYETFNGKIPEGFNIDHLDQDKSNNDYRNLEAVLPSENSSRANRLTWILTTKAGDIQVTDLVSFCKSRDLSVQCIYDLCHGRRKSPYKEYISAIKVL